MLETVGIGMKTTIVPELQAAGVVYYLFPDRTTANKFWGSRSANYNTTSYCAFTGYGASLTNRDIAVMIRTKCSNQWTGGLDTNMWIQEVTQHESGHAFDFSFAQKNMLNPKDLPSLSSGFNTLVNADLSSLDAAGHPATCTEFGTARTPSGVESGWPTTHLPAVCNGNGVINSTYTGKTNKAISQLVSKYFLAPPLDFTGCAFSEAGARSASYPQWKENSQRYQSLQPRKNLVAMSLQSTARLGCHRGQQNPAPERLSDMLESTQT